ncbi:MAG: hypothetical protein A2Y36_18670 [Treponema sp. GWA1_62_8]|nr:MAG: hypothetical protein A2Y36_18670 [Treponema sp. GWA1_62_8]
MKEHLFRFLRTPLGLAVVASNAALLVFLPVSGTLPFIAALPLCAAIAVIEVLAILQTRLGANAVVAEKGRERDERDARILGGVAAARKRLSLLRIADAEVASAVDRVVLASGLYLESSIKGAPRSPEAEDAVISSVEIVGDYLRIIDASSSARRMRAAEGRDASERATAELAVRTLTAAADEIERISGASAGASASADRLAAREELE